MEKLVNNLHIYIKDTCKLICYQRVSHKAANTVWQRFCNINSDSIHELSNIGLGKTKLATVLSVIQMPPPKEFNTFIIDVSKIKGIGPWTVKWLMNINNSNKPEIIYEDLEVRKGLSKLMGKSQTISITEAKHISKSFDGTDRDINVQLIQFSRNNP
jgi:3-methyladenine DNA glycosylase/8-oxoguanine DNA glycosylase